MDITLPSEKEFALYGLSKINLHQPQIVECSMFEKYYSLIVDYINHDAFV